MKPKLFLMTMMAAAAIFAGCSKDVYNKFSVGTTTDPPPYAASNTIWTVGSKLGA